MKYILFCENPSDDNKIWNVMDNLEELKNFRFENFDFETNEKELNIYLTSENSAPRNEIFNIFKENCILLKEIRAI
jgi:hypothetical protein